MAEPLNSVNWVIEDPVEDDFSDGFQPVELLSDTTPTDPTDDPPTNTDPQPKDDVSSIYQFLQKRGIEDPSKIKFENENGETEDHDFNSLSSEEQLSILDELTDVQLSDHETEVINFLRQNNTTLEDVLQNFADKKLQEYLENNPDQKQQQNYSIDDYNDDELYLADLKSKFNSFTDDELYEKLTLAKSNEALFKKEVDILRDAYKSEEDQSRELQKQQEKQYYDDLKNNLVEAASNFNEISLDYNDPESDSLIIEDGDRQKILSYLLNQDTDGKSQFVKDLDDPQVLIELAWFRTQGSDVISGISKYWKDTLKNERKELSKLKKQMEVPNKQTTTFVVPQKPTETGAAPDYRSLGSKVNLQ